MRPGAIAMAALLMCGIALAAPYGQDRPNILWITCEDISADLGCYGNEYARTPNLDKLAADGLLFFTGCTAELGCELWVSNGTASGTMMVEDFASSTNDGWGLPLAATGELLLFSATDDTHGNELWTLSLDDVVTAPTAPTTVA